MDFATLVLNADSRGLVSGERALDSLATTAGRTEGRVVKANVNMARSTEQVGRQSIFASQQMRMTSMQLSQVAQQASVTGNWLQAIAIQLPDLALGFGPIGIAAGAAAGAVLMMVPAFTNASGEADALEKAMKGLQTATEGYADAVENASLSAIDLIDRFGSQAEAAGRVYEALRKIKELEFASAMREARDAISDTFSGLQDSMERFDVATTMFGNPEAITAVRTEVQYLENEFGLTLIQATRINDALNDLAAANSPEQLAASAMALGDELARATEEGARLSPELLAVQKDAYEASLSAAEFARLTGAAIEPANALAVAVSGVANEYARAAAFAAALTGRYPSRGSYGGVERSADGPIQNGGFMLPEVGPTPEGRGTPELSGFPWESIGRSGRRRGGGAGRAGGAKKISDEAREAKRIFEETRTEAEKYAQELEDLNELHNMSYLDADTYARAVKKIGDEYNETSKAGEFFNDIAEDFKEGILDAILEGEKLDDVFKNLAKSIARAALEAALFGSGPFAAGGGKGGGGLGGLLGSLGKLFSFDGGGHTSPGSRSGGLDGRGGFLAMMHPNETVIDHTKGGGFGSYVGGDIIIQGNADQRTLNEMRRMLDQRDRVISKNIGKTIDDRNKVSQTRKTRA
ncbi:hypothetical protein [Rhizobium halophilum]|uniref:hypothetical protein n=1 Tax=Rhizobium halophilum TaxID=2846852 RepID=UPI001EFE3424|nr:hypothetical protein [Rhizobium halophilum]MCF6371046.1 hypothetical protein [Rhizobium halophilum]